MVASGNNEIIRKEQLSSLVVIMLRVLIFFLKSQVLYMFLF